MSRRSWATHLIGFNRLPFGAKRVALLSELIANEDFMRFSAGVYSYKQMAAFLEKILAWPNRGCIRNLPCSAARIIN
jgi:hypothetical protein